MRSSVKLSVGEEGPDGAAFEAVREVGSVRVMELDRETARRLLDDESAEEIGTVGVRGGGYCRIRLKPEAPRPCSCSVMTGDLKAVSREPRN